MCTTSAVRAIRAAALAFLTLAAFGTTGCGGGGSDSPTGPLPSDPGPSDPGPGPSDPGIPPQGPAPVGNVMYAVDLANNFLVFGSGSIGTLTQKIRITGLPILKRIIGLATRPADHKLYGVGNDSRVYTIDPLTAVATPVSSTQFSPKIAEIFDVHFAMALEPNGDRVRLIAAESGGNWSISLVDGTATSGAPARYAEGTPLAGRTPRLLGIVFAPYPPEAAARAGAVQLSIGGPRPCEDLLYAIDVDEALWVAACDPNTGDYWPAGGFPDEGFMRCGELMPPPDGITRPEGENGPPEDGGPWFPRTPDTPLWILLNKAGEYQNRVGYVLPVEGMLPTWQGQVPSDKPIQSTVWAELGISPYNLRANVRPNVQFSVAGGSEQTAGPADDPGARCN